MRPLILPKIIERDILKIRNKPKVTSD